MRSTLLGGVVAALISAAILAFTASDSVAVSNTGASFGILCKPSHSSFADPMMFPNRKGPMLHDFYGSRAADKHTTNGKSLRGTPTTCGWEDNSSSYWHPRLRWEKLATGAQYHLKANQPTAIYYKVGNIEGRGHRQVESFPPGFKLLAGAEGAHRSNKAYVRYNCKGTAGAKTKYPPKRCKATQGRDAPVLMVSMRMPECWDGVRRAKTYKMYDKPADVATCPPAYPVQVPEITFFFNLTIPNAANSDRQKGKITVHMGKKMGGWRGPRAFHADYMNGWRQNTLDSNVKRCINQTPKYKERPDSCRDPRNFS